MLNIELIEADDSKPYLPPKASNNINNAANDKTLAALTETLQSLTKQHQEMVNHLFLLGQFDASKFSPGGRLGS